MSARITNATRVAALGSVFQRIRHAPVHPYLFAFYPIVFLYAQNAGTTDPMLMARPVVVAAIVATIFVIIYWLIVRDVPTASCMASTALIAFFVLWSLITRDLLAADVPIPGWSPLIPKIAYVALFGLVTVWIGFRRPVPLRVTTALNVSAVVMTAMALWPLRAELVAESKADDLRLVSSLIVRPDAGSPMGPRPDVFFIILDAYGREDVLREEFGYDNSPFLQSMQEKGFLLVQESLADYDDTLRSLSSCLQMSYLGDVEVTQRGHISPRRLMYEGPVHDTFRSQGYSVCAISPGFSPIEPTPAVDVLVRPGFFTPIAGQFEAHVLNLTPVPDVSGFLDLNLVNYIWRQKILHSIQNIHTPLSMGIETPVFVQAHIVCPHNPYVLDAEGNAYDSLSEFTLGDSVETLIDVLRGEYIAQVQGVNQHIERAIDLLLETSTNPPIIIVISDHGPPTRLTTVAGRQANLCLLHLPGIDPGQIPQDLHLVNLFRLIFNLYFDAELPLLNKALSN